LQTSPCYYIPVTFAKRQKDLLTSLCYPVAFEDNKF